MNRAPPPSKAGRREWIGLAVIALPCVLYSMDLTVLDLAVPALSASLKQFVSAFAQQLPHLDKQELYWRLDIISGALTYAMADFGVIKRPSGMSWATKRAIASGSSCCRRHQLPPGNRIEPGATLSTRTLSGASSRASALDRLSWADFVTW